ncbi:MAG: histidine kinase [Balneolaceae bacterium]|nr:histidine kinase [Balneolaceae bacterium]
MIFWIASILFLTNHFSRGTGVGWVDFIYTLLFHISLITAVVVNSFVLIPRLLAHRRYLLYGIGLTVVLAFSVWLNIITFRYLADWIAPGYYFISYYEWYHVLQFMIAYVGITSLLQLSQSWFRELDKDRQLERLEREKVSNQLRALRAQINPHFLFNSLNHIYLLARRDSREAAPAVLQLSDLLRYAIRHMPEEKVPLKEELDYLSQYVTFYKSRLHQPERVEFNIDGHPGDLKITPLLLVIFVENCFKHGSTQHRDDFIRISITIEDDLLVLETKNTIPGTVSLPDFSTGIGMANARQRLELLYGERHELDIDQSGNIFTLDLKMQLT